MLKVRLLGDRKSRDNILNISSAASLEKAMSSTYPLPPWRRQCPQHILCHLLGEGNVLNIPSASLEKALSSLHILTTLMTQGIMPSSCPLPPQENSRTKLWMDEGQISIQGNCSVNLKERTFTHVCRNT